MELWQLSILVLLGGMAWEYREHVKNALGLLALVLLPLGFLALVLSAGIMYLPDMPSKEILFFLSLGIVIATWGR